MNMTHRTLLTAAVALILAAVPGIPARAKITLPDIISDNMVLQQNTTVNLWGHAAPASAVTITVSWPEADTVTVTAGPDGLWLARVDTPAASFEPRTITVDDRESSVTIGNILIGEVWLCSGQSNMEMPLQGFWDCPVEHSAELIATSGRWKGVRVVKVPKTPALTPQDETPGKWMVSSPENAPGFTAVGYTFAQMLTTVLDVPVGIIDCSWGGASVEGWSPRELLDTYPDIDVDGTFRDFEAPEYGWQWSFQLPMIMYNGMLHPLRNYTIKGFLWYQGCANVGRHGTYAERLGNMVAHWRGLWREGDIPFYMVELAPFFNWEDNGISVALLREAQFKASRQIPNSGIVGTNDLVYPWEEQQIHPSRKQEVGERLAYMALNKTYGYTTIACEGPACSGVDFEGDTAVVRFDNDGEGLSPWTDLTGFEIAGEDRVFHPAEARIDRGMKRVLVRSDEVPSPVAVRYCFRNFLPGSLRGSRLLPAYPFRTDDWQ